MFKEFYGISGTKPELLDDIFPVFFPEAVYFPGDLRSGRAGRRISYGGSRRRSGRHRRKPSGFSGRWRLAGLVSGWDYTANQGKNEGQFTAGS